MHVLINGTLLFFLAFFIHLFFWKLHLPKHHTKILLTIFLSVLLAGILFLNMFHHFNIFGCLQLSFLYISMTLAYITTYSGIEVDSPSLMIALKIKEAGLGGFNEEALQINLTDGILVKPRIRDLYKDKMIYLDQGKYKLTSKGILLARVFIFYRSLLNSGKGG
jgi:hypothetical protein